MFSAKVIDNFLSKEDCEYLINSAVSIDLWEGAGYKFWDNRITNYSTFLKHDKHAANILLDTNNRSMNKIKEEYGIGYPLYSDSIQIVRWFEGMDQGPHADDMSDTEAMGHGHRSFGSVIYLNDNYIGGHTYYSNFNIEVVPKTGSFAFHPADPKHSHGVTKIENSTRYTIASFWTFNEKMSGNWSKTI